MRKLYKYKVHVVILVCFIVSCLIFYPGTMSTDSITQFNQAVTGSYTDWHPPLMAFLWSKVLLLGAHSAPFLFLQIACFWGAIFLIYQRYKEHKYSWVIILLAFCPWVLNFMGVLWKDVQFAYALLLLVALGININSKTNHSFFFKIIVLIVQCLLFFYALNLRHNGIFSLIPIGYLFFYLWCPNLRCISLFILSCLLIISCFFMGKLVNDKFLKVEKTHPEYYVMIDDLYNLSLKHEKSLIPSVPYALIKQCEDTTTSFIRNPKIGKSFCLFSMKDGVLVFSGMQDLSEVWLTQVLRNKLDYLDYKKSSFMFLLRVGETTPFYTWHGSHQNLFTQYPINKFLNRIVDNYVYQISEKLPIVFFPFFWVVIMLCQFIYLVCCRKKIARELHAVCLSLNISGLIYICTYFLMTTGADFRYVYWGVLATSTIFFLVFIGGKDREIEL